MPSDEAGIQRPTPARGPAEAVSMRAEGVRFRHFANLDVLRLVAAASVILSHGYLIAQQTEANEPFKRLSGDISGLYGVQVFFIISGLLVTESWMSKPGTAGFLWRRFLRIVPGFFVCNVVTLAIAGLFFYPAGGLAAFVHNDWRAIVKHIAYITGDGYFDGVKYYAHTADFSEGEVNGSTWSLQQELICYVLLALLAAARWLKPVFLCAALGLVTFLLYRGKTGPDNVLENFYYAVPPFASGVLAWWVLRVHRPRLWIVFACAGALASALALRKLLFVFPPCAAYMILYLCARSPFDIRVPRWVGDVSYGTYLWGWPVQQMVKVAVGEGVTWWQTVFGGLLGALACGYLSWWLVEKPALRLKGLVASDWSIDAAIARRWRAWRARRAAPAPGGAPAPQG